jgi:poly(3-hydroxybutyrate) depolymerase
MLYQLYEAQRASLEPVRLWAGLTSAMYGNLWSPLKYIPASKYVAAGAELVSRLTQRYEKPTFGLHATEINGKSVAVTEEIALSKPFCKLLHFKRAAKRNDPVVLMVAPLSGHFSTLLRETVRAFLPEHEVYITDWADARMVPISHGAFRLDDYVSYVQEFIRFLGHDVHVISVCQPTVPVLVGVSLMAQAGETVAPKTMIMMGGPIDTRRSPTAVNDFARLRSLAWFEQRVIASVPAKYPGYLRRVYPGFLQLAGFIAMNPERHVDSHKDYFRNLVRGDGDSADGHRKFYDEYNAVMDLPAEYYLETIKKVFQEHHLPLGKFVSHNERVNPAAIAKTALFSIEGALDDISGNGQTKAAQDLCTGIPKSRKKHLLMDGVGHYGIFSGRKFREGIYPNMRDFIRKFG